MITANNTAEKLSQPQVAHLMPSSDIKKGTLLLFLKNHHQDYHAIGDFNRNAVIGEVLTEPEEGFGGHIKFKTDIHGKEYYNHLKSSLVAIVKDLLTPAQRNRVKTLIYTSADDCRSSLKSDTDMDVLNEALNKANESGYKTKAAHITRRINQLRKGK